MTEPAADQTIDLRTTKCPLNFVKARLALEKLPLNSVLEVWINRESDSVMNIPKSMEAEGHTVIQQTPHPQDPESQCLWIRRDC